MSTAQELFCHFCGKPQGEIRNLIGGGGKQPRRELPAIHICNECVDLSYHIVHQPQGEVVEGWTRFMHEEEDYEWAVFRQMIVRSVATGQSVGSVLGESDSPGTESARQVLRKLWRAD